MRSAVAVAAIGAAGAIVAWGTVPAPAATTSGVRYEVVQSAGSAGPNGTECAARVLSAAVSAGSPAYVSARVDNNLPVACTAWLQSSVNGGTWNNVSPKQTVPGGQGLDNAAWYKTANYYAGPGTRIRACAEVQSPMPNPTCSRPVSLASSTAKPAIDATSVYYRQSQFPAGVSDGGDSQCSAYLSSSTKSKAATSQVNLFLWGEFLLHTQACTGWLESSTNNGKTWEQATPTYSVNIWYPLEYAFSPAVADGTGHLARACVRGNAPAKNCTAAW